MEMAEGSKRAHLIDIALLIEMSCDKVEPNGGGLTGILLGTLVLWRRNALDAQVPFLSWLFRRR